VEIEVFKAYEAKSARMEQFLSPTDTRELCFMSLPKPDSPRGQDQQRTRRRGEMVCYYLVQEV